MRDALRDSTKRLLAKAFRWHSRRQVCWISWALRYKKKLRLSQREAPHNAQQFLDLQQRVRHPIGAITELPLRGKIATSSGYIIRHKDVSNLGS